MTDKDLMVTITMSANMAEKLWASRSDLYLALEALLPVTEELETAYTRNLSIPKARMQEHAFKMEEARRALATARTYNQEEKRDGVEKHAPGPA